VVIGLKHSAPMHAIARDPNIVARKLRERGVRLRERSL
jgi:hypothetical protein